MAEHTGAPVVTYWEPCSRYILLLAIDELPKMLKINEICKN